MKYLKLYESKYEICSAFLFRDNEQPLSNNIIQIFKHKYYSLFKINGNILSLSFYTDNTKGRNIKIEIKQHNDKYIFRYVGKQFLYYECDCDGLFELIEEYVPSNLPINKFDNIISMVKKYSEEIDNPEFVNYEKEYFSDNEFEKMNKIQLHNCISNFKYFSQEFEKYFNYEMDDISVFFEYLLFKTNDDYYFINIKTSFSKARYFKVDQFSNLLKIINLIKKQLNNE